MAEFRLKKDGESKIKLKHAPVRASQAVLTYGVGAMVDFTDQTLMTGAPELWEENTYIVHDERAEKVLGVDYFACPTSVVYSRFPQWYFCPKCRKFKPLKEWIKEYREKASPSLAKDKDPNMINHMLCYSCHVELVAARIVSACECGHLDDFPWIKWVHAKNNKNICGYPNLKLRNSGYSEGLEAITIECTYCKSRASLAGALNKDAFETLDKQNGTTIFKCTGFHPHKHTHDKCCNYPRALQRGSSSVYFPTTFKSLVIPPYSERINKQISDSKQFNTCLMNIADEEPEDRIEFINKRLDKWVQKISIETTIHEEDVKKVLIRKWLEPVEVTDVDSVKYKMEEYAALCGEISSPKSQAEDFIRKSTNIEDYNVPFFKSVSLIEKIRVVTALLGFSRLKPAINEKSDGFVCSKEPETRWYPAYEVRGEGIFIELNNDDIEKWIAANPLIKQRVDKIEKSYSESFFGRSCSKTITPKYVLLHTLSHLLIKQLSFECGYNVASLSERIYSSDISEGRDMSGILIYTASGDAEGTLGGLVRQGKSDMLPGIIKKALSTAAFCSNDPICIQSHGQGHESLNLAACHSCALLPETSCEDRNSFLDRAMLVGTLENPEIGFVKFDADKVNINLSKQAPTTESTKSKIIRPLKIVNDTGTDMIAADYSFIWDSVSQWTDNATEKMLLSDLRQMEEALFSKEKPVFDCYICDAETDTEYACDLIWLDSKVMYFSSDKETEYYALQNSGWKCFLGSDSSLNAQTICDALKEK